MKKVILLLAVVGLTTALMGPAHTSQSQRTVTKTYSITSGYITDSGEGSITMGTNWAVFTPRPSERMVSLSIEDATGRPVLGKVFFWRSDGWADREVAFCAATDRPIRVRPNEKIYVGAYVGECTEGALSVVTTGTITANFSH